jgi:hypothetical protein
MIKNEGNSTNQPRDVEAEDLEPANQFLLPFLMEAYSIPKEHAEAILKQNHNDIHKCIEILNRTQLRSDATSACPPHTQDTPSVILHRVLGTHSVGVNTTNTTVDTNNTNNNSPNGTLPSSSQAPVAMFSSPTHHVDNERANRSPSNERDGESVSVARSLLPLPFVSFTSQNSSPRLLGADTRSAENVRSTVPNAFFPSSTSQQTVKRRIALKRRYRPNASSEATSVAAATDPVAMSEETPSGTGGTSELRGANSDDTRRVREQQEHEANIIQSLVQLQQMGEQSMNSLHQYIGMLLATVKQQYEQIVELENKLLASDTLRKECADLKCKYAQLLGERLEGLDVQALEQIEALQLEALRKVKLQKIRLMQEQKLEQERQRECKVCNERSIDIVFVPCGHLCCCSVCSQSLSTCIVCRRTIDQKLKTFTT